MAEVGLVLFARTAPEVMQGAPPAYAGKSSRHTFTQPQPMTTLRLMRFEGWTFRGAEVRIAEHPDLRRALGPERAPDHTTPYRLMRRVTDETLGEVLAAAATRLTPRRGSRKRGKAAVAVGATGLAPGSVSTFFINRRTGRGGGPPWRHRRKRAAAVDVLRRRVPARGCAAGAVERLRHAEAAGRRRARGHAGRVGARRRRVRQRAQPPRHPHPHIREAIGAGSIIPAKRGESDSKTEGVRAQMRRRSPRKRYSRRARVEGVFSAVKRELSAKAPGRSGETRRRQAMLPGLAYNIYLL